jgi:hypothetical protein
MTRQIISTPDAPTSPLYSQGVKAGSHVFVSGTTGIDAVSGAMAGDTIQLQTRQALTNCQVIPPARYAAKLGAQLPGLLVSIRMTAIIT